MTGADRTVRKRNLVTVTASKSPAPA